MKKPVINLWVGVYGIEVIGLLGWECRAAETYIDKTFAKWISFNADGGCGYFEDNKGRPKIIVWISPHKDSVAFSGLLAHECIHAAMAIMERIGQPVCNRDHEHFTWLVQYIFVNLLGGFRDDAKAKKSPGTKTRARKKS